MAAINLTFLSPGYQGEGDLILDFLGQRTDPDIAFMYMCLLR